jgi:hypothetical protein
VTEAVASAGAREPLLQTTTIAKSFGPVVALRSVQLSVAPGEAHALLGANGAGKSTLVKILTGVVRPDAGEIRVDGHPVTLSSPADARRHGLAPVFQDPALVADLTVRENLRLTGADVGAVQAELEQMGLAGLDLDEQVRDIPLPFLRMIDLARAGLVRPAGAAARRDHRRSAAGPVGRGFRGDAALAGAGAVGAVHQPPAGRGAGPLRHVHRAPRRSRGRLVQPGGGR